MILQRDHQAFHGTQGAERDHYDQRQPQRRVNPIGRMEQDLCDQGGADDDRARRPASSSDFAFAPLFLFWFSDATASAKFTAKQ